MRFYTFKEKKPKIGEYILAKLKEDTEEIENLKKWDKDFVPCPYYVLKVSKEHRWGEDIIVYIEAMGEEYAEWEEDEIIGWTPLSEIRRAEKWQRE